MSLSYLTRNAPTSWLRALTFALGCAVLQACSPDSKPGVVRDDAVKLGMMDTNHLRVYQLRQKVADFPATGDLSTPEKAYAAFNRALLSGEDVKWRRISVGRLARTGSAQGRKREVSANVARELMQAEVIEVRIYRDTTAVAFARVPHPWKQIIDVRSFERGGGRWLNSGNCVVGTLDDARAVFLETILLQEALARRDARKPVADPAAHLQTYVEFLRKEGQDPKEFLLQKVARHPLVLVGELHHRPGYWAFNSLLVSDPRFAEAVDTIYLEMPMNDQPLIDRFLAAPTLDPAPVIAMLRDFFEMGWPDQAMLDFFVVIWKTNQSLPPAKRLRIVLVDMARPWNEIRERNDWRKYDTDRDALMARNIVRDWGGRARGARHALFIVGAGHALASLHQPTGEWVKTSGWHLRRELGPENVYVILQHRPVSSNLGRVGGRVALGLFDSALVALGDKSIAFPLDCGPFGEELYDASLDHPTFSLYRDAGNGYLYLGPLEEEIFSPLIPGFYTAEHMKEIDRRYRLMNRGRPWHEIYRRKETSAEQFVAWMAKTWGRPRPAWSVARLGPLNAWQYGSDWQNAMRKERLRDAAEHPGVVRPQAERLFAAIREADYTRAWRQGDAWLRFLPDDTDYLAESGFNSWVDWVCREFRTNPIASIDLGQCLINEAGLPTIEYKLVRQTGSTLEGKLPFDFNPWTQRWYGRLGLDWHLRSANASE